MTKLTVECGHCGKTLGLKQRLLGQTTECKACHSQCDVQPDGRVTVQPAAQTIPDTPTEAAKGDAPELLEWLEDLFVKMIYGIFKFTFVRLPREIWRFLVKAFPTLMRALKVLLLGLLWVALAVGPFMWTQFHKQIADSQLPGYAWYCDHQFTVNCLLDVYSVSALIGSV